MIEVAEQDKDSTREMDVSKTIRWGMISWYFDVNQSTTQNCWFNSGLLTPIQGNSLTSVIESSLSSLNNEDELIILALTVAWQRGILVESIPAINDFVSPSSEEVLDDFNTLEE
ncbi:hypothetical protein K3495_g11197 [Podosphaera aphanis]|nr:hypothetical protein K3495_g11197 [Podosphaera aphanis]